LKRYLFTRHVLPSGFRYPKSFLEFIEQEQLPDLFPWKFLAEDQVSADGWREEIERLYPSRTLVPFANYSGSDDFACFEAAYPSEDPVVHYVHAYASSPYEDRGNVANFLEWIKDAESASAAWRSWRDRRRKKKSEH
jgi:hypothetical protein